MRCSTCGAPSTNSAVDIIPERWTVSSGPWLAYEPEGVVKYGCDDHPVTSKTRSHEDTTR